jgi:molybdate transport system ATP-binding protein
MSVLDARPGRFHIPGRLGDVGTPVRLRIRSRDVIVATEPPKNLSALNILKGKVSAISATSGPLVDVRIDCSGKPILARITRQSLAKLGLKPGRPAYAIVKSVSFDAASLARMPPTAGKERV